MEENKVLIGILTVSDSCASGEAIDTSGQALTKLIEDGIIPNAEVRASGCVSDDEAMIIEVLTEWADNSKLHLIITTGGTGMSLRDVTPEAVKKVLHREANGLSLLMASCSLQVTPLAALARPVCGTRNGTLILTLPGSAKASQECLSYVAPTLPHALDLLAGRVNRVTATHTHLQAQGVMKGGGGGGAASSSSCGAGHHHHHHSGGHKGCHHNDHHKEHHHHNHSSAVHASHNQHVHPASHSAPNTDGNFQQCSSTRHNVEKCVDSKLQVEQISRRARKSPYPMISVDEAQQKILSMASSKEPVTVALSKADGFVLACDVIASAPLPPFPASIKDGYAVLSSDGCGRRRVAGGVAAGDDVDGALDDLQSGVCVRINTGAPVPAGADAVVQVEDTKLTASTNDGCEELEIEILKAPTVGQDIRPIGCDIAKGQTVLTKGTYLGPAEIGLAASVGAATLLVYSKPIVGLLSTGNELVSAESGALGNGEIYDSNLPTLAALLQQNHVPHITGGAVKDTTQHLKDGIKAILDKGIEVLVTTGGVSMGDRDMLRPVLEADFDATVHFAQVFMKPGKPTTFASLLYNGRRVFVLGLPGNPVSATVTANLYLLPLVRKIAARQDYMPTTLKAKLQHDIQLDPRPEYHRATLSFSDVEPLATSTGNQLSSRLLSCARAAALLVLPASTEQCRTVRAGELVQAILLT